MLILTWAAEDELLFLEGKLTAKAVNTQLFISVPSSRMGTWVSCPGAP